MDAVANTYTNHGSHTQQMDHMRDNKRGAGCVPHEDLPFQTGGKCSAAERGRILDRVDSLSQQSIHYLINGLANMLMLNKYPIDAVYWSVKHAHAQQISD